MGKSFWTCSKKSDLRTYDNIQKCATGQGDHHETGCLLDYPYFNEHFKLFETDSS